MRRLWGPLVPCVIVAAIAIVIAGAYRTPTPPAAGTSLNGPPTTRPASATLRVAGFNIHSAVGTDGKRDLERVAKLLGGFHVVGLNEIHGNAPDGFTNQADWLGRRLGMASLFAPTERRWWKESFGNGFLASVPVESWVRFPILGTQERGRRNVLIARLPVDGAVVTVLLTHVDCCADRVAQMRFVRSLFLSLQEPALLIGDLNTRLDDPELRAMLDVPGVVDAVGKKRSRRAADSGDSDTGSPTSHDRIDWLLSRGMEAVDSGIVRNDASDHPLVWAEFRLTRKTP